MMLRSVATRLGVCLRCPPYASRYHCKACDVMWSGCKHKTQCWLCDRVTLTVPEIEIA